MKILLSENLANQKKHEKRPIVELNVVGVSRSLLLNVTKGTFGQAYRESSEANSTHLPRYL